MATKKGDKAETFMATILEDNRITIPRLTAKIKGVKKGKTFEFAIIREIKGVN